MLRRLRSREILRKPFGFRFCEAYRFSPVELAAVPASLFLRAPLFMGGDNVKSAATKGRRVTREVRRSYPLWHMK